VSRRLRVLVLDDDDRFRGAFVDLLSDDSRIDVIAAVGDADAALAAVARRCPDVAVVDVRMPGTNGVEATRLLRAVCPGMRVFGLSLYSDASHREAMQDAGAERYFVKGRTELDVVDAIFEPPPEVTARTAAR